MLTEKALLDELRAAGVRCGRYRLQGLVRSGQLRLAGRLDLGRGVRLYHDEAVSTAAQLLAPHLHSPLAS